MKTEANTTIFKVTDDDVFSLIENKNDDNKVEVEYLGEIPNVQTVGVLRTKLNARGVNEEELHVNTKGGMKKIISFNSIDLTRNDDAGMKLLKLLKAQAGRVSYDNSWLNKIKKRPQPDPSVMTRVHKKFTLTSWKNHVKPMESPSIVDIMNGVKATIRNHKHSHNGLNDITTSVIHEFTYQAFEMYKTNISHGKVAKLRIVADNNSDLSNAEAFTPKAKESNGGKVIVPWISP